ncbi:ATP-dependent RNA helicase DHX57 isoform X1 [Sigmodon hispidus]
MSSVRRKGKPGKGDGQGSSRGGRGGRGHTNKSGGGVCGSGGGGGGSRKASNRIWDDGDDFCVFTESKHPRRPSESNKSKGEIQPKWKPRAKVSLQMLYKTSENQEKVKALLRDLQEQGAEAGSKREIFGEEEDDEPECDDEQCWPPGQEPTFVPDPITWEYISPEEVEPPIPEFPVSQFAMQKLSRHGLNTEHCHLALRICDRDLGAALEHLLDQCFSETFGESMKLSEFM